MRRYHAFTVTLFLLLACLAQAAIFQRDSTARFKVLDFDGNPISNAVVNVNTLKKWIPGEGFGRDVMMNIGGKTDTNRVRAVGFGLWTCQS